jgi:hypothetical protein
MLQAPGLAYLSGGQYSHECSNEDRSEQELINGHTGNDTCQCGGVICLAVTQGGHRR